MIPRNLNLFRDILNKLSCNPHLQSDSRSSNISNLATNIPISPESTFSSVYTIRSSTETNPISKSYDFPESTNHDFSSFQYKALTHSRIGLGLGLGITALFSIFSPLLSNSTNNTENQFQSTVSPSKSLENNTPEPNSSSNNDGKITTGNPETRYYRNTNPPNLETKYPDLYTELRSHFNGDKEFNLNLDIPDRKAHSTDFSHHSGLLPLAVIYPETEEDISVLLKLCSKYKMPVIPVGGATSLEGHTLAKTDCVIIDFAFMRKVIDFDEDSMTITVEPGITWQEVNRVVKKHSLFLPIDPGPGATLGGMCSTNASGPLALKYRQMASNVVSANVVLANGSIVQTGQKAPKTVAGYDLTRLFTGSEGTLGVVASLTVRLFPLPKAKAVAVIPLASINDATDFAIKIQKSGVPVMRMELLDEQMIRASNLNSRMHLNDTKLKETPTLFLEFGSFSEQSLKSQVEYIQDIAQHFPNVDFQWVTEKKARDNLWHTRKMALFNSYSLIPNDYKISDYEMIITDVAVPLSKFKQTVNETRRDLEESGIVPIPPMVAHLGDGNFHLFLMYDTHSPEQKQIATGISDRLVNRAIQNSGTCTAEHGIGWGKKKYLESELGENSIETMRLIKRTLDPHNILNPHKVVDI